MPPPTTDRVLRHPPPQWTARIRHATSVRIERAALSGPEAIEERLAELDREWDLNRTAEAAAALTALAGLGLGALVGRRWRALTALAAGFLLQHSLAGWSAPAGLLRRRGVRTAAEIAEERYALKALRGDFASLRMGRASEPPAKVHEVLQAVAR